VATVRESSGKIIALSILPTEDAALLEFFAGMRGAIHVAFEEGTQAQWLHDLLSPRVSRVVVCDRRGAPRQGNKGDQVDSAQLSELLRTGQLRSVYHGRSDRLVLKELTRAYDNLVEDSVRAMLRMKALFRARAIRTEGSQLYEAQTRGSWLDRLPDRGCRFRADTLGAELDVVRELRRRAKAAMLAEARKDPAYERLCGIPFFGPVRVAQLLATMQTPWRFRTKRNLWAYAGLAVVTHSSADYTIVEGRPVRRRRQPMTRGLNRNHNRVLKNVFKGAANAAVARPGPLKDFYDAMVARGMREELARVTLARKLAAVTLRLWKTGEPYDARKLTLQAA
jgi:transposase